MKEFLANHFDAIITIIGFIITYFMMKKSFKEEIKKDKIALAAQAIQSVPYDICQLMDSMIKDKSKSQDELVKEYGVILTKVLAYGSKNAVKIAIKMQQLSYALGNKPNNERFPILAAYALLITQLKFDLTSEIISPESWFQLRMTDYGKIQSAMKAAINTIVKEAGLNYAFNV